MNNKSFAEEFALRLRQRVAYTLAERGFYKGVGDLGFNDAGDRGANTHTQINVSRQIGHDAGDGVD